MKYKKCYPNFKFKAVTFSFDDGTHQDFEMVNMLNKFNMKGTFNLNSNLMYENSKFCMDNWLVNYRLNKNQAIELFKNHEIAGHTSNHTDFKNLNENLLKKEIDEDIKNLSDMCGYKIVGFAYPYGIYNDEIIDRLIKNHIIYSRSTKCTYNFDIPNNWFTYGGTCTISCVQFPKLVNKWIKTKYNNLKLFYIWGHSYELDMHHEHEKIYNEYEKLANHDDCWYATNKEIVSYLNAFKKLRFYKNSNSFTNNSDRDLYIICNNQKLIIKAKSKFKINL